MDHRHRPLASHRAPARDQVTTLVLLGALAGSSTLGCESVIGADFGSARLRPKTSTEAGVEGGSACQLAVPPSRPTLAPSTDAVEFTIVVRSVDIGDVSADAGATTVAPRGYDMDGVCTTSQRSTSCAPRPWVGSVTLDGPGGRDNAVGQLLVEQQKIFGLRVLGSDITNEALTRGVDPPIGVLRIRGFSGFSEDDHVEVDWFVATTLAATTDGGTATAQPPAFDTTDRWPVFADTVANGSAATAGATVSHYRDANAFVSLRRLVAHFDQGEIPMRGVFFAVTNVSLTGDLQRDPVTGVWALENGVVEARGSTDVLMSLIPEIASKVFGVSICTDDQSNYPRIKRYVCSSADLPEVIGSPTSAPCTGSSVGMSIVTAPASLGNLVPRPPRASPCSPATDPRQDTCAVPVGGG